MSAINWEEAGVTRAQFQAWWIEHSRADYARKAAETAARSLAAQKAEHKVKALAKLTNEEKQLLGLIR